MLSRLVLHGCFNCRENMQMKLKFSDKKGAKKLQKLLKNISNTFCGLYGGNS
jgi:hypothetical protein